MGFKIEQFRQWFSSSNLGWEQRELSKLTKKPKIWAEKYGKHNYWGFATPSFFFFLNMSYGIDKHFREICITMLLHWSEDLRKVAGEKKQQKNGELGNRQFFFFCRRPDCWAECWDEVCS